MAHTHRQRCALVGSWGTAAVEQGEHTCMRGTLMAPEQESNTGRLPVAARQPTCSAKTKHCGPAMRTSAALSACEPLYVLRRLNIVKSGRQVSYTYNVHDAVLKDDATVTADEQCTGPCYSRATLEALIESHQYCSTPYSTGCSSPKLCLPTSALHASHSINAADKWTAMVFHGLLLLSSAMQALSRRLHLQIVSLTNGSICFVHRAVCAYTLHPTLSARSQGSLHPH